VFVTQQDPPAHDPRLRLTNAGDLSIARGVLLTTPDPGEVVAEAVRLVRPGATVAFLEADPMTHASDPPLREWRLLAALLRRYAELEGIDLFPGRRLPRLLRSAGLVDVGSRLLVDIDPSGPDRRWVFSQFVDSHADRLRELVAPDELDRLQDALRRHLEDPGTVVRSRWFVHAWGRRPEPTLGGQDAGR
jgi:hypothetical protein